MSYKILESIMEMNRELEDIQNSIRLRMIRRLEENAGFESEDYFEENIEENIEDYIGDYIEESIENTGSESEEFENEEFERQYRERQSRYSEELSDSFPIMTRNTGQNRTPSFGNTGLFINRRDTSEVQRLQNRNTRGFLGSALETSQRSSRPNLSITSGIYPSWRQQVIGMRTFQTTNEALLTPNEFPLWGGGRRDAIAQEQPYIGLGTEPGESEELENLENLENVKVETRLKNLIENTEVKLSVSEDDNCSICQEQYKMNDIVREIKYCNHYFHINCVERWLSENHTCPECRMDTNTDFKLN
jgi:predicted nucleic acid binding AN1-type Zn finger protein